MMKKKKIKKKIKKTITKKTKSKKKRLMDYIHNQKVVCNYY